MWIFMHDQVDPRLLVEWPCVGKELLWFVNFVEGLFLTLANVILDIEFSVRSSTTEVWPLSFTVGASHPTSYRCVTISSLWPSLKSASNGGKSQTPLWMAFISFLSSATSMSSNVRTIDWKTFFYTPVHSSVFLVKINAIFVVPLLVPDNQIPRSRRVLACTWL